MKLLWKSGCLAGRGSDHFDGAAAGSAAAWRGLVWTGLQNHAVRFGHGRNRDGRALLGGRDHRDGAETGRWQHDRGAAADQFVPGPQGRVRIEHTLPARPGSSDQARARRSAFSIR